MPKHNIQNENELVERSPVVVIMGHIDHGKSTLLDYIRKTNIVDKEAGGITQHISAYEVIQKDEKGREKRITFLDTPGHEAFSKMRQRGAEVADIAILIVSAEDGVKPQTVEAWKTIIETKTPCIVAINKIDKPAANIEKTKIELAEKEVYVEGFGGNIPVALISAKTGEGVDNLLMLINILAEMENFTGDADIPASGFVIEANRDQKRGIEATLIIKNGTLKKGMTVVVEDSVCSTRMMENFLGKIVSMATFSSPIRLIGFDKTPKIGGEFFAFETKEEALEYKENHATRSNTASFDMFGTKKVIPIILKADVSGSIEAIEKEIGKIKNDTAEFRIVARGEGPITESDIKSISQPEEAVVIGFNVKGDKSALDLADRQGIKIHFFNIIYKMTEFLEEEMEKKRPRVETLETVGKAKIIRVFSETKERRIMGGKVTEGRIELGNIRIMRRDNEIGRGKLINLEKGKVKVGGVEEGFEFGMMVESKIEIVPGDVLESFAMIQK